MVLWVTTCGRGIDNVAGSYQLSAINYQLSGGRSQISTLQY